MVIVDPNHECARVPFRIESNFHLRAEDIVIRRHKEEDGRRVVNCAVKRIDKPIRVLARAKGKFGSMLDVPGRRYILPGKSVRYPIYGGFFSESRACKRKKQRQAEYFCLKSTHGKTSCRSIHRRSKVECLRQNVHHF